MRNLDLEYDILLDYEYQLANRQWTNIYDLLADVGDRLYPHFQTIQENRHLYPVLVMFVDQICQWNEETYENFMAYSRDTFHSFLFKLLRENLTRDFVDRFFKSFIVIDTIGKGGDIILNEEWCRVFSSPWGIPMVIRANENCRTEAAGTVQPMEEVGVEKFRTPKKSYKLNVAQTEAEHRLQSFWNKLVADDFEPCYIWKNCINTKNYKELVNRLQECKDNHAYNFVKRFALVLVVYMAEWYKREYNGNDKANPLTDVGISRESGEIWINSGLPDNLLYKMRNNKFQDSIFVLGGLPIKYLVTKQFSNVLKEISTIFQERSTGEELKKNLFINNFALQESTRTQWGSLHAYFECLMEGKLPIAEEDRNEEPFRTFISNLQDWNQMRRKIEFEWLVVGNLNSPILRRMIRLHFLPEANGARHKSISYDRLARWGISTKVRSFKLYLVYNGMPFEDVDEEAQHIDFYNTYDGYFVGRMKGNHFTFTDVPTYGIRQIQVGLLLDGFSRRIVDTFDVKPYLQLFETEQYSLLSSRKASKRSFVLLPYDTPVAQPADMDTDKKYLIEGGLPYKLIEVNDVVCFTLENNQPVSLYNHIIGVNCKIKKYFDKIKYSGNGCVNHYYTDDDGLRQVEQIPLVFDRKDIQVVKQDENVQIAELKDTEYRIEFKQDEMPTYQVWTKKNRPHQGVVKVRISSEYGRRLFVAYFAPAGDNPFSRNLSEHFIQVAKEVAIHSVPEYLQVVDSNGLKSVSYRDDHNTHDAESEVVFQVGDADDFVEVPVFRPFLLRDVYKDHRLISRIENGEFKKQPLAVPFLLKDHFSIRTIDENGVHFLALKDQKVSFLDFDFEDQVKCIDNRVGQDSPVGKIGYYLTRKLGMNDTLRVPIENDGESDYKFFYWSMKMDENPVPLVCVNMGSDLYINLSEEQKASGLIFQSLKNGVVPASYYQLVLMGKWPRLQDMDYAYKCFEIAAEYGVPFRMFEPIYCLFQKTDSVLIDLAANFYLDNCEDEQVVLEALTRFSNEMYFSWPMLNIRTWREVASRILRDSRNHFTGVGNKDDLKQRLHSFAVKLFHYVGKDFSIENKKSLEYFTSLYWGGIIGTSLPFTDYRWYGVSSGGKRLWQESKENLAILAIRFMRARPIYSSIKYFDDVYVKYKYLNPNVVGFTKEEFNDNDNLEFRDLKQIKLFLRLLESDSEAYVHIEQFFRRYLIKNI